MAELYGWAKEFKESWMKAEKKYRWGHPFGWLQEACQSWSEDRLRAELLSFALSAGGDEIQDRYQDLMDDDGYFDEDSKSDFWEDGEDADWNIPDLGKEGACVYIANPGDVFWGGDPSWDPIGIWKHFYLITMSEYGPQVYVNADHEQEAIDYAIDFCQEMGWEGLFLDDKAMVELMVDAINDGKQQFEYLDEYPQGGNAGRHLSSHNVAINQVKNGRVIYV